MRPHEPSLVSAHLPAVGGRLGPEPEDFVVDEVPLYAACGQGEHRYLRLQKRNWNTPAVVRVIGRLAGVETRDIGYAGMKDRHSVSSQWFSLPARSADPATWELPEGISILESTFHNNKLRTGHLLANRFCIRVVDIENAAAVDEIAALITTTGAVNAFGAQRFGFNGNNLDAAFAWLRANGRARDRFAAKMLPSVLQSEFFNRYADARVALGEQTLIDGEWVRITNSGSHFRVDDLAVEQPRRDDGTLVLTGPLPGGRQGENLRAAAELDRSVWASMELDRPALAPLMREAPGARRDLRLIPEDFSAVIDGTTLTLRFTLPSGAFATQLVREFTRSAWLEDRAGRDEESE